MIDVDDKDLISKLKAEALLDIYSIQVDRVSGRYSKYSDQAHKYKLDAFIRNSKLPTGNFKYVVHGKHLGFTEMYKDRMLVGIEDEYGVQHIFDLAAVPLIQLGTLRVLSA